MKCRVLLKAKHFIFEKKKKVLVCVFYKGDNFCDFLFWLCHTKAKGSKVFPYRVDPFSEGRKQFDRVISPESVSPKIVS